MSFLMNLNEGTQFIIQLIIVLICLFYGAKKGGMALGLLGGVGLFIFTFGFHMNLGKPAVSVMLTILAVVSASATLQASGGLDVMLQIAEKILRKNPKYVSILAPLVTCTLTVLCGTGHVVYTVLPIVYDIAIKNNIRPERPMAASSICAQLGIIASPVSVAVVTLTAFLINDKTHLAGFDGYIDLLKVTIPATYIGVLVVGIYSMFRGKSLDKDKAFQERLKDPEFKAHLYGDSGESSLIGKKLGKRQWAAMWIFLGAIVIVAILGYFKELRPVFEIGGKHKAMSMVDIIQIFMLLAGTVILIFTKTDAAKIASNAIFKSGMIALVAVFGISWMADSMFGVHTPMIKALLGDVVSQYPWTYAVMLLIISKFVNSQAAALVAFVPLAIGIGVSPGIIVAFASACYGYYILPTYPSDLAAIQFDRSGTTHIGKFVINHSFILPGLIGVITACIFGYLIAGMAGYVAL
ncbi:anaerobic C4-dicarboxylate transporter [Helicobacter sp. 13S00401-1]|uniref:anaerobic C4-dicarboxylate transporter n=1 Tax=Helicobacter sp. 13S00401-1 TaxID=1905758 RepID=UPI000BA718D0|nr:anaerobic C4-dicarboxylate transporter [Helicobacter sp. 13S00401-1]PAF50899.1 anaerobic C4-dicarboxylate transporter [Helicobacter sp. 13S00401-1]